MKSSGDIASGGSVPVPDPTVLTTQQLIREMESLGERFELMVRVLETRLDGMDKAINLLQQQSDRIPSHVDEKVGTLKAITSERFDSVQNQFRERDVRTESSSKDAKVAVDAALQAQKEAVGKAQDASDKAILKSEVATTKQIDQIERRIQESTKATDGKIDDIKERLVRVESERLGGEKQTATTQAEKNTNNLGIIAGIAGTVLGVGGIGTAAIMAFLKH